MAALKIKDKASCQWDLVSLGEVMLRLDPGERRIATARQFHVWEGGGEYNVARGLRRCFGMETTVVTALVDNPVGRLVEDLILQAGRAASHLLWREFDGTAAAHPSTLNVTQRRFAIRPALRRSD